MSFYVRFLKMTMTFDHSIFLGIDSFYVGGLHVISFKKWQFVDISLSSFS